MGKRSRGWLAAGVWLAIASCGASAPDGSRAGTSISAAPIDRAARAEPAAAIEPAPPPAPGVPLAGGRLRTELDGLAPSEWSIPGAHRQRTGPGAPSVHALNYGGATLQVTRGTRSPRCARTRSRST